MSAHTTTTKEEMTKHEPLHLPGVWMLQNAKARAKARGLEYALTVGWAEEKLQRGTCDWTGIKFDWSTDREKRSEWARPFAPSIERIDPNIGYTPANCVIVVWILNRAKANFRMEDFDRMCVEYLAHKQRRMQP